MHLSPATVRDSYFWNTPTVEAASLEDWVTTVFSASQVLFGYHYYFKFHLINSDIYEEWFWRGRMVRMSFSGGISGVWNQFYHWIEPIIAKGSSDSMPSTENP